MLFSLAIAAGITPQLLPAAVSTSLAAGSRRMAARKVLVKRLVCIEDLGDIDVLFTDKTGTLTHARLIGSGRSGHESAIVREMRVVLWLARGADTLPTDPGWLTVSEAAYAADLRFAKRRTEYLLRRLAAKHAVAAAVGLPTDAGGGREAATLARVEVRNHPTGAPYVLLDGAPCGLEVSISDRAGWAVCLVSRDADAVGCDLELVEPRSPEFVRDFLTEVEQDYVAAQPDGDARDAAANLLWSAKESALKVLRTGLRRDTRSVVVSIHDGQTHGWTAMTVRTVEGTTLPGWWRREGLFLLTVAAPAPILPPVALEESCPLTGALPGHSWLDRPLTGTVVSVAPRP